MNLSNRTHYLIAYDIGSPKLRRQFLKILSGFGLPYQFSLYELFATKSEMRVINEKIEHFYKKHYLKERNRDRLFKIVVVPVCRECYGNCVQYGCSFFDYSENIVV